MEKDVTPPLKKYDKLALTYTKQINLLESRGLLFRDKPQAEKYFSQINYYRLSAYCLPFEVRRHKFREDVCFEHIQQLYEFDRQFRFLLDEALEVVEIAMRTAVAHHLSRKYDPFIHEDSKIFFNRFNHISWIEKVHEEANRSKETFIQHYKETYIGFPALPIWMAVEVMSFGAVSQMVSGLLREDQIGIAKKVGSHSSVLCSWLHTFTYVRNMCAHHCRLWNKDLAIAIVLPKDNRWQDVNPKQVISVIFALNQFLLKLPAATSIRHQWRKDMECLLSQNIPGITLTHYMGLPIDFKNHPLWKNV